MNEGTFIPSIPSVTISLEEYKMLVRNSSMLEILLSHNIERAYPSEVEKEILRIRKLVAPLTIEAPEDAAEGEDA